jgi:hypothetical protein
MSKAGSHVLDYLMTHRLLNNIVSTAEKDGEDKLDRPRK